jgi:hypothetical protein
MKNSLLFYDPSHFQNMTLPVTAVNEAMLTERMLGHFSPLEISPEAFTKAYELPIGDHVEKNYKGLSYLSWPFAFRYLKEQFPAVYVAFEEKEAGWPVFGQEGCWLLRPYLTDGIKRTPALVFPLMDNKHNALKALDARAVSDNIQRASVKCIATFTGLGLKLYSGEDIPKADDEKEQSPRLPLQQTTAKPSARRNTKEETPASADAAIGGAEAAPSDEGAEFDGKAALLSFGEANPLGYPDRTASMKAVKAGLEALGLAKGEDVKDKEMFANVVTTMVASWAKAQGIKITKADMAKEVDCLRATCSEGSVDNAIKGVSVFVEGKK